MKASGGGGKRNPCYEHEDNEAQSSCSWEENGRWARRDGPKSTNGRQTSYSIIPPDKRRVNPRNEVGIRVTVWGDRKPWERGLGARRHDGAKEDWFKIVIPNGVKYEKTWLVDLLRSHCSVPFTPVDFHYTRNRAEFFVRDAKAASALRDVSYKIYDEENRKICIFTDKSAVPYSVRNTLEPEEMAPLQLAMRQRYDVFQKALDLSRLRSDPGLVAHGVDIILNQRNHMTATLQIIKENFPELVSLNLCDNRLYQLDGLSDIAHLVPTIRILNLSNNKLKSIWEVDKMKTLELEELWLDGNPLCDTFVNQVTYVSAVWTRFPKLLRLDGEELVPRAVVEAGTPVVMKPCMESYDGSEGTKNLILQFLQQYYWIYDHGDRQGLRAAYHAQACFSLTVPLHPENPAPSSLQGYLEHSRNMLQLKDPFLRWELLRHTDLDIVNTLRLLPQTVHDFSSFLVDLWVHTDTMFCFTVYGLYKEVEGNSPGSIHAFVRTFVTLRGSNSSLCIMNDKLLVRDATPEETQRAFSVPLPMPTSSSVPTLSQEQQEMVQTFSAQSGMNLEWSQKCLADNEWNYTKAVEIFIMLKNEGKIPEEAFKSSP